VWDEGSYIAVDRGWEPLKPEAYTVEWTAISTRARVEQQVTLHGVRHGRGTRMLDQRIPVHLAAAWHGHDPVKTLMVYANADKDELAAAGAALAGGPSLESV
jgi:integrase